MGEIVGFTIPAIRTQLARIRQPVMPRKGVTLEPMTRLLGRLGDPHRHLPPVFHVAGTNGKGSTCAYLRAMLEAEGLVVHAATKPHLVTDDQLSELLDEVLNVAGEIVPSFFEVMTAACFLAFARVKADACVIETGLGGRLDATNVLVAPAVCGIASLGIDHEAILLTPEAGTPTHPMARIAFEKASIAKPRVPLVTQAYSTIPRRAVAEVARAIDAPVFAREQEWRAEVGDAINYSDRSGDLWLPLPQLVGAHQAENATLAVAMLRHQDQLQISSGSLMRGIKDARWPARMQLLGRGPLTELVPGGNIWLDGGHNLDAGVAISRHFAEADGIHLIIGMLATKDPTAIVVPLAKSLASISVVPIPYHEAHAPDAFAPHAHLPVNGFYGLLDALAAVPAGGTVLIAGSLYLAGEVLRLNGDLVD